MRFGTRVRRFENVGVVLVAVVLGIVVSGPGRYADVLVTPLVVFLIYGSLRGIDVGDVESGSYGLAILCSLGVSYVVLPFGGIRVADALLAGEALAGMAIVLAAPTTAGSAIIWTRLAGGDSELAALASIGSLGVAPLLTPAVLSVLLEQRATVPIEAMVIDLLVIVGGGVALLVVIPDRLVSETTVDRGSGVAILVLIYSSVASVDVGAIAVANLGAVSVVVLLLLLGAFALVRLVGRTVGVDRSTYLALFFTGGLKNLGVALVIAFAYASATVVVVVVTYYVLQQFVGAVVADVA